MGAFLAARLTGRFVIAATADAAAARRAALVEHDRIQKKSRASGTGREETQINRRVDLNLGIRRLEGELAGVKTRI